MWDNEMHVASGKMRTNAEDTSLGAGRSKQQNDGGLRDRLQLSCRQGVLGKGK